ncbi:MAG: hypothetical protein QXM58_01210 [Candidatus Micrarchaeaceae archaeon]
MLGLGLALLSVGAINMLIPIIIIIVLIGAAGASMRGMSIFDFFGISVLFGIGAHGKGTLAGKNVYKMGRKTTMAKTKDVGKKAGGKAKEKVKNMLQDRKQIKQTIAAAKSMPPWPQTKKPPLYNPTNFKKGTIRMAVNAAIKVAKIRLKSPTTKNPIKTVHRAMIRATNAALLTHYIRYIKDYEEKQKAVVSYNARINWLMREIANKTYRGQSTKPEEREIKELIKKRNAYERELNKNIEGYKRAKGRFQEIQRYLATHHP